MTPELVLNPSSSTRSWLRVKRIDCCSLALRLPPMASISSMKIRHGARSFAAANKSRTLLAPTPTYISSNSEPDAEKNGTPASPATAFANSVFPVPGGPISSTPRGNSPPNRVNFSGSRRNWTISWSSILASLHPFTSSKLIFDTFIGDISFWFPRRPTPGRRSETKYPPANAATPKTSTKPIAEIRLPNTRSLKLSGFICTYMGAS
mmetsp:Transcript_23791/g.33284  ORF Transcript_23791/g.33284 Transcript_23791/m.33284 type:complete len:207 (-) Transcript_23791:124-744(-)